MIKFRSIYIILMKNIMASLRNAKEVIRKELEKGTFDSNSVATIEWKIAELEAAKIEWKKDPSIVGLHARYLAKFEALDEEAKRNLSREIERARARQDNLRAEITGVELPASVLWNEAIMAQLKKLWIIRNNRAVFENSNVQEKLTKYLEYLNYISDVELDDRGAFVNPAEIAKKYRELLNDSTDWILDKEYLQFKYAESIYNDIIRRGFVLQKNSTGEYTIVCPKVVWGVMVRKNLKDTHPDHPYLDIVHARNTRKLLDVVVVTSMIRKDFGLDAKKVVGQKTLITRILQEHNIKSKSWVNIQKADLLLLDWDRIKADVDTKLKSVVDTKDGASMQAYNELMHLRNFIENEEYNKPDYNRDIFTRANIYRKGFLNEKALIDAFGGSLDNATPENFMDVVKKMWGEARGGLFIFAILALIGGFKKTALWAAGIALLGPSVAGIVETWINGTQTTGNLFSDEELELIRPHAVIPILDNNSYQAQFEKLASINKTNLENSVDDTGRTLPSVANNFIIAKILNEFHKSGTDINITSSTAARDTLAAMGGKDITNTEFPNFKWTTYTITLNDIKSFLQLIESDGFKEAWDISLSDVMSKGRDIRNQNYESFDFTVDGNFDREINNHLRTRWAANTTVTGREKIKELQTKIESKLSAGVTDNFFDSVTGRNTADVIRGLPERLTNIDDLIAELNSMGLASASIDPLIDSTNGLLPKYKTFMEADAAMSEYDGLLSGGKTFITDKWDDFWTFVGGLAWRTWISDLQTEKDEIDAIITKITPTSFEINGTPVDISSDPLFQSIVDRANTVKNQLEQRSQKIQEEIDRRDSDFLESITGEVVDTNVENLEKDESSQDYRNSVRETTQAISNFKSMVSDLEADRNISKAFENINDYTFLQQVKEKLEGMTLSWPTTPPAKSWLLSEVQSVFWPGQEMERFMQKATEIFTAYFSENQTTKNTVISMSSAYTTVDTIVDNKIELDRIEQNYKNSIGWTDTITAFLNRRPRTTDQEKAYIKAKDIFGSGFSVPNDTINAAGIFTAISEKRREIADGIHTYINSITTSDIDTLEELKNIDDRGVIELAKEEIGNQVVLDYVAKLEDIGTQIMDSIPATPDGIDDLIEIDNIFQFTISGWFWQKVRETFVGADYLKQKFTTKVEFIGENILSGFSEDMTGLAAITDFRNDAAKFEWIASWDSSFRDSYQQRLEQIQETVRNNTYARSIPEILTTIENVVASIDPASRLTENTLLDSFTTSASTKTITLLVTTLGLNDNEPSGMYNGFEELERRTIYNKLKELKIIN